jgi:hypothetical protein
MPGVPSTSDESSSVSVEFEVENTYVISAADQNETSTMV